MMERLTNRDGIWRERMDSERINRLYKQLAAYENTGFTPEDFDELCRFMSETRIALGIKTFDELRKAVEDGAIIRLPCRRDSTVYRVVEKCKPRDMDCPFEGGYGISRCHSSKGRYKFCGAYIEVTRFELAMIDEIGKTVFLTREEAEAALVRFADGRVLSEGVEKREN